MPLADPSSAANAPPPQDEAADLIRRLLALVHHDHPAWTVDVLLGQVAQAQSPWLLAAAQQTGFPDAPSPMEADREAILSLHAKGVWSDLVIAEEINLPIKRVRAVLAEADGYGLGTYGKSPFGGRHRQVSDAGATVLRRVSVVGQMSYRSHTYSLGMPYRGRVAALWEHGPVVVASFCDRPALHLTARHHLPRRAPEHNK